MNQGYYNYEDIQKMKDHAKKYNEQFDKKSFLKNVSILEQKIILMTSENPYEVLNYLDELDDEKTKIMLSELNYEEINKLLDLFNSEQKKHFYANFSQTSLVNKFIANDKQAFNHVDNLELDRKIELLDSSKESTKQASQTIYQSISESDKLEVKDNLQTAEASVVIDEVTSSSNDSLNNTEVNEQQEESLKEEVLENIEEEIQKQQLEEEKQPEEQEKPEEQQEEKKDPEEKQKEEEQKPELEKPEEIEAKEIPNENLEQIDENERVIEFQEAKSNCEQEIIKNAMQNKLQQEISNENSYVKTL